jgi:hypothetical protein
MDDSMSDGIDAAEIGFRSQPSDKQSRCLIVVRNGKCLVFDLASELEPAERIGADPIDRSRAQFLLPSPGTGFNQLKFEARTAGV